MNEETIDLKMKISFLRGPKFFVLGKKSIQNFSKLRHKPTLK
jgi:hypothetical protein